MRAIIAAIIFSLYSLNVTFASSETSTIAVIGGGMSGTAAAAFLEKSKHKVHLFEMQEDLGGNAQTFPVDNGAGETVMVDIGPQYYAKPAWNLYLDFLKHFDLYNKKDNISFNSSIAIFNKGEEIPDFRSFQFRRQHFKYMKKQKGNLKANLKLFSLLAKLRKLYKKDLVSEDLTIGEVLEEMKKVSAEDKHNILRPVLASVVNANIDNVDSFAARSVAKALGFRNIFASKYYVSKVGFGPLIQEIGRKVEKSENVTIHRESKVTKLILTEDGKYQIGYENQGILKTFVADKVIFAVNPMIAKWILTPATPTKRNDSPAIEMNRLRSNLGRFQFQEAHLVLHTEESFIPKHHAGFFNIKKTEDNSMIQSLTMNLKEISPRYGNILKSWVYDKEEYKKMKAEGKVLAETVFHHPMVNPLFYKSIDKIKLHGKKIGGIYFAGGWTTDFETQYSAIEAAYKAVKVISPEVSKYWEKQIKRLKKVQTY